MEELFELGLTKNESKVYTVLVQFGKLGAGEVSSKSGVSYGKIYDVLDSLVTKGFAKVIPEKSKRFAPSDPAELAKIIEDKKKKLNVVESKIKELKKFYDVQEKNPVIMGIGQKGFYKIIGEMSPGKKYCYNIKWASETRADWKEKRLKNIKDGVEFKELVRYDSETKANVEEWAKVSKNLRKIENDGLALSIIDDYQVMIGLIKSNVTLLIRDKSFTKIMKKMFLYTYNNSEPIK